MLFKNLRLMSSINFSERPGFCRILKPLTPHMTNTVLETLIKTRLDLVYEPSQKIQNLFYFEKMLEGNNAANLYENFYRICR